MVIRNGSLERVWEYPTKTPAKKTEMRKSEEILGAGSLCSHENLNGEWGLRKRVEEEKREERRCHGI